MTGQIAFAWNGLPHYAARQIRAAIAHIGTDCPVIGSKPSVPHFGMEESLGQPIKWIPADIPISWKALELQVPDLFFQPGWAYPAFNALGKEVKAKGGQVVGFSDANWRRDLRQIVFGAAGFRLLHRRKFDAMLVPGREGRRLMSWFGMPQARIREGLYGADPVIFHVTAPLAERPKTFLYVGQFIERKNVLRLARAFLAFSASHPDWTLRMCGSGQIRGAIPAHPRIVVEEFLTPERLAKVMNEARFLILPSLAEAWGLAVHEASLCGCGLLLSDRIGCAADLAGSANAFRFGARSEAEIVRALRGASALDGERLARVQAVSVAQAAEFGPTRFTAEVASLISELLPARQSAVLARARSVGPVGTCKR